MDIPGILHADLDAFYAAVAVLEDPSLEGKAVAVGTGVVLSCTYEARKYGVRGGMRMVDARARCPHLVLVDGTFRAYTEYSEKVFRIFESYTPKIERISIDEAFLDISGSIHLFGTPEDIGTEIRQRVKEDTGLAVSIGATTRKFLSKIASQVAKPDGLIVVEPGSEAAFLHPLDVSLMWGVGPVTERKLNQLGIHTIGDIADSDPDALRSMLGPAAAGHMYALAHNQDPRPIQRSRKAKSVGAQSAIRSRIRTMEELIPVLQRLTDRVAERLRAKDRTARTVTVRVRFGDLSAVTRSATMPTPTSATGALLDVATALLQKVVDEYPNHETSLVGISTSGLGVGEPMQLAMGVDDEFSVGGTPQELEYRSLDSQVDELRKRFGRDVVTHGSDLMSGRSEFSDGLSDIMTLHDRGPIEAEDDGPEYVEEEDVTQREK
ncbi:MAG: DNA polymerase IV [Acidimicrobiia bacterium]